MEESEEYSPIDWDIYGAIVRMTRRKMGYKNFQSFSDTIYRRTRVKVAPNVIKRIEQGAQQPTASQFIGINMSLFGEAAPTFHDRTDLAKCASEELQESINSEGAVPDKWRRENLREAVSSKGTGENIGQSDLPDYGPVFLTEADLQRYREKSREAHESGTLGFLEVDGMRVLLNDSILNSPDNATGQPSES